MQSTNEWAIPFLSDLQSGQNCFTVSVPLHFCYNTQTASPNKLYFSKLDLVPDFFSLQAEELDLDTVEQENMIVECKLSLSVVYGTRYLNSIFRRPSFKHGQSSQKNYISAVLDFLSYPNPYFIREDYQQVPMFFWDFYDVGEEGFDTVEEYVENNSQSARREQWWQQGNLHAFDNITTICPFLFTPDVAQSREEGKEGDKKSIRLRFHLQPKTTLSFSNAGILSILGFNVKNNPHIKIANKQYHVINNSSTEWLHMEAERSPSLLHWKPIGQDFPAKETKVMLRTSDPFIVLREQQQEELYTKSVQVTHTQAKSKEYMLPLLQKMLQQLSIMSNIHIEFDVATGKLGLPDPAKTEDMLASATLMLSSQQMVDVLGYKQDWIDFSTPHYESIVKTDVVLTQQQKEKEKQLQSLNFELKSKSLVFDTNIVYVIAQHTTSSDRMHPLAPSFVASLHPKDGIMKMHVPWLNQPDFFRLADYQTGTNQIVLHFELYTILSNTQHVKLNWKPAATVSGIIRARM